MSVCSFWSFSSGDGSEEMQKFQRESMRKGLYIIGHSQVMSRWCEDVTFIPFFFSSLFSGGRSGRRFGFSDLDLIRKSISNQKGSTRQVKFSSVWKTRQKWQIHATAIHGQEPKEPNCPCSQGGSSGTLWDGRMEEPPTHPKKRGKNIYISYLALCFSSALCTFFSFLSLFSFTAFSLFCLPFWPSCRLAGFFTWKGKKKKNQVSDISLKPYNLEKRMRLGHNLASESGDESESEDAGIGGGGGFLDFLRGWSSAPSSELLLLLLRSLSFRALLSFSFFFFSSSSFSFSLNRRSSSASSFFLRSSSSRRRCSSRFFQSLIWSDSLSLQEQDNLSFRHVLPHNNHSSCV